MSKLNYACKTCFTEEPTKVPRFCDNCSHKLRDEYTRVQTVSSAYTWPKNLRFCACCAPTYHDAQTLTEDFLRSSPRMAMYRALGWVTAVPLALVIFPTIFIVGTPVYLARKTISLFAS